MDGFGDCNDKGYEGAQISTKMLNKFCEHLRV